MSTVPTAETRKVSSSSGSAERDGRRSPRALTLVCSGISLHERRDELGEAFVGLACAALHTRRDHRVARLLRREERRLGDRRPPTAFRQTDRVAADLSGRAVEAHRLHDLLRLDDLEVLAAEAKALAVLADVDEAPLPARSELHVLDDGLVLARAPPPRDEVGIVHRLPYELAPRVELARHHDLRVAGKRDLQIFRDHLLRSFRLSSSTTPSTRSIRSFQRRRYFPSHSSSSRSGSCRSA